MTIISIHPMLFFIVPLVPAYPNRLHFNTSYVIFYPVVGVTALIVIAHFNTSYVIFYPTVLSHFLIIILHKSLYFSRFLLYFTTLR